MPWLNATANAEDSGVARVSRCVSIREILIAVHKYRRELMKSKIDLIDMVAVAKYKY